MATIDAVVECLPRNENVCSWPIFEPPDKFIRLHASTPPDQVGRVVFQLAMSCGVESFVSTEAVLQAVMAEPTWILPGGLRVQGVSGVTIAPTCCCGVEDWREWFDLLKTGESPFLGHDPAQGIERVGDVIQIVSCSSNGSEIAIELHPNDFVNQLQQVENDLKQFLLVLRNWADRTIPAVADDFVSRFDEMFEIARAGSKPNINMVIEKT